MSRQRMAPMLASSSGIYFSEVQMKTLLLILLLVCFPFVGVAQTTSVPAQAVIVNKQTGTTYTVASVDRGRLVTFTNGSAIAATLPRFSNGWYVWAENRGVGTVTITPSSGTIDGAGTLVLTTNQGVLLASDGTNYFTGARGKEVAGGDVVGPGSSTDNAVARFDGTTGKLIQNSSVTIDDNGSVVVPSGQSAQSPIFKSTASDPADAGVLRLGNNEFIEWEANPTGTDVTLGLNTSNVLAATGAGSGTTVNIAEIVDSTVARGQFFGFDTTNHYFYFRQDDAGDYGWRFQTASGAANAFTLTNAGAATFNTSVAIGAGSAITSSGAGGALGSAAFAVPTTVGTNVLTATNPSAIAFPKVAADNSVSFRTPPQVLSDIGAQASGNYITALTGDGTAAGPGSAALTLASVITAGGPTGSATVAPIITYDAKGRLTTVSSATITPAVGSITGLGTGVGAALAINVGSAGAPVLFNGAGGTPSSLTGTNIAGTAAGLTAGLATDTVSKTGTGSTYATGTAPTITNPVITNIAPGADFTITQNSVAVVKSENTSAAVDTLHLKAGFVGVGVSSPTYPFTVNKAGVVGSGNWVNVAQFDDATPNKGVSLGYDSSAQIGLVIADTASAASNLAFWTYSGAAWGERMRIGSGGAITLTSGVTNAAGTPGSLCYNTSTFEVTKNNALTCTVSYRAAKDNIFGMSNGALARVNRLRPVKFAYRDHLDRQRWGFIAEEVAAVDPKLADAYVNGEPKSLDQNAILALLTKATQELSAKVDADHALITAQHKEISRLRFQLRHRR